jgi:hypothetical protein
MPQNSDDLVHHYSKSDNTYLLNNGEKFTILKEGDYFSFEYEDKIYYYADLISAENSLNSIAIVNEPSKKDLISIKKK